jgi:hypothetical protein
MQGVVGVVAVPSTGRCSVAIEVHRLIDLSVAVVVDAVAQLLCPGIDIGVVVVAVVVTDGHTIFVGVVLSAFEQHVVAVVIDAIADLRGRRVDALGIVIAVVAATGNVEEAISVAVSFMGLAIAVEVDAVAEIFCFRVNDGVRVIAVVAAAEAGSASITVRIREEVTFQTVLVDSVITDLRTAG